MCIFIYKICACSCSCLHSCSHSYLCLYLYLCLCLCLLVSHLCLSILKYHFLCLSLHRVISIFHILVSSHLQTCIHDHVYVCVSISMCLYTCTYMNTHFLSTSVFVSMWCFQNLRFFWLLLLYNFIVQFHCTFGHQPEFPQEENY